MEGFLVLSPSLLPEVIKPRHFTQTRPLPLHLIIKR
jgi:hypothetical protein